MNVLMSESKQGSDHNKSSKDLIWSAVPNALLYCSFKVEAGGVSRAAA